jgi:hypothetical protein
MASRAPCCESNSQMTPRRKMKIGILAMVVCGVLGVVFWPQKSQRKKAEPVFEGRKLSEWVIDIADDRASHYGPGKVAEAITAIGTDGVPFYVEWLAYKRSHLKRAELYMANSFNSVLHLGWVSGEPGELLAFGSLKALNIRRMGNVDLIPSLLACSRSSTKMRVVSLAITALRAIGPPAVPALITLTTNQNAQVRDMAMYHLVRTSADERVIAQVTLLLNHPDPHTREDATNRLSFVKQWARIGP